MVILEINVPYCVKMRVKSGELGGLFHVRASFRILQHRLILLRAGPLSIIGDPLPIQTFV